MCDWLGAARRLARRARTSRATRRSSASRCGSRYRDREILTNPPPSAGGTLLAYSLALLDRGPAPPPLRGVVEAMAAAQPERTPEFLEGLAEEGFLERFLASAPRAPPPTSRCSTRDGCACSVTCTNGEGSGVVVPGTGMHLNNVMGEEDLNPFGFHRHPAGTADAEHDGARRS